MSPEPDRQARTRWPGRRPRLIAYITPELDQLITRLARQRSTTRSAIAHQLMRKGAGLTYHLLPDSSND